MLSRTVAQAEWLADGHDDVAARHLLAGAINTFAATQITVENASALVRAHSLVSRLALRSGDLVVAAREVGRALSLARSLTDDRPTALARVASARVLTAVGDHDTALTEVLGALAVLDDGADTVALFHARLLHGAVLVRLGSMREGEAALSSACSDLESSAVPAAGVSLLRAALSVARVAGWVDLGDLAAGKDDEGAARQAWRTGVRVADGIVEDLCATAGSLPVHEALVLWRRAECLERLGEDDLALEALAALPSADRRLPVSVQVAATGCVARMLRRRGESARAFAQIERAVEHAHAHGGSASLGELYELGSRICEEQGDLALALEWFKRFHRVHREARGEVGRLRAQVLAVQWDLEKLSAAAASERARADELQEANQNLTDLAGRLERHALMDPLTGVANRRRLDQHLSAAHAEAVARGVPCCVALLDLDDFKLVNDRFSHAAGDGVLRRIGRLLANHRRASDLVARFGGEEFVIVFSDTDVRGAARVCERLRRRIEAEDWSSVVGGPSPVDGLVVTASFGVGDMAAHRDVSSGLAAVDALLYQAKAAGRNRVISAATAGP